MNKLLSIVPGALFGFLLLASMPGCKAEPEGSDSSSPEASKGVLGYSMLELENPFFNVIADSMQAEAEKHGYELLVVNGDRNPKTQADQIDDFIVKGVAAIVLNPCDSKTMGPAIKKANDAGIPVFTNDLKHDGDEGEVVCHIATDNYQGGKLAGEAMVKAIGEGGGEVAIIDYPSAESCQERVRGFREVIDAHNASGEGGEIKIVSKLNGGGVEKEGFRAAKDTIESHAELTAIFAINDPSGMGAYAALENAGKVEQVTIIAFDGQLMGKKAILEGKFLCDPIQFPDQIGRETIQMIVKYFSGEEVPKEKLIPSKLYYKEDAERDPELQQ